MIFFFIWMIINPLFYELLHWGQENLQTTSPTQTFIDHLQEQLSWMKDGVNSLPFGTNKIVVIHVYCVFTGYQAPFYEFYVHV